MRTIFTIAKNELKILFYSPVAWLMLIVFCITTGLKFSNLLNGIIKHLTLGYPLTDITYNLFLNDFSGLFPNIQQYLYFFIPLLTMGIMSNETNTGSIKLLFSSPIRNTQIVLGKFLSLSVYGFLLMLPLLLYAGFGYFAIESMDIPPVLTAILGLYFLSCVYFAIGLFMSGLTRYQIIAALGTLSIFAALQYVGKVGQQYDFIRDITYWLSISGRASEFIRGLINSADFLYFVIITSMFLTFAVLQLRFKRSQISLLKRTLSYTLVVLFTLFLGYFSSKPSLVAYYDATRMKSQTLTPNSQNALAELKGKINITTYVNIFANDYTSVLPQYYNNDLARFRPYIRFKPQMRMSYKYYYHDSPGFSNTNPKYAKLSNKEKAQDLAKIFKLNFNYFLSEEEGEQIKGLAEEDYRFTRIVETEGGCTVRLRNYEDMMRDPSEAEITAAIKTLTVKAPKVGFLSDRGERDIFGRTDPDYYSFAKSLTFRYALISQGFETVALNLINNKIPDDIDILVIADPKSEYSSEEIVEITRYINSGGNLLIAVKPNRVHLLNPISELLGINFTEGTLVQQSKNYAPDLIFGSLTTDGANLSKAYAKMYAEKQKIAFPGTVGIKYNGEKGFETKAIVASDIETTDSTLCWNEVNTKYFDDETPKFDPEKGEQSLLGIPLVLNMERTINNRSQRIVVMGSADCISNGEFQVSRIGVQTDNYNLITESFRWFTHGEFPIDASRESGPDNKLKVDVSDRKMIKRTFSLIIPSILAFFGMIILIRRRNH